MAETVLDVALYGRPIGTMTLLGGTQTAFAFNDEYIEDTARPTLSLSFKGTSGLLTRIKPTRTRIPPFFANLLPEGPLRSYLAKQAGVHPDREFFLLSALGRDLPGAVTVINHKAATAPPGSSAILDAHGEAPEHSVLRFSLAGVQLKFSALLAADGGLTVPTDGVDGSWIVKLPSPTYAAVPENEFAMLELARSIGIDVPKTRLVDVDKVAGLPAEASRLPGKALAIRRFDRLPHGAPVHIEDFAQVFGVYPQEKYGRANYGNLAQVIQAEAGQASTEEFIRRLIFSVLIGNADMHLKNWSLVYPDGRHVKLAPAYDFVSTVPYLSEDGMALNLYKAGTKAWSHFTLDGFARLAARARAAERSVTRTVRETVARFHENWRGGGAEVPPEVRAAIDAHLDRLQLMREVIGS
ncbi:MAG: type II toxin-antitoxin system HipA family toxin [Acidobacteria bacterium]|nr:type II toxin-antitoxin system HipA family toxin [Acidobacteriota bacterium]